MRTEILFGLFTLIPVAIVELSTWMLVSKCWFSKQMNWLMLLWYETVEWGEGEKGPQCGLELDGWSRRPELRFRQKERRVGPITQDNIGTC